MKSVPLLIALSLMASTFLAGCLAGDDLADDQDDADGASQGGLGSVQGTILTVNLDPAADARIQLVKDNDVVHEAQSDPVGKYTIRNVEPGEYRVHITAACCRENVAAVTVVADKTATVDVQLVPWTDDDLERPRVERYEWTGFLACSVSGGVPPDLIVGLNVCGLVDLVTDDVLGSGNATDDDFLHVFEIRRGLKTLVGGMSWQAAGAALGDELWLTIEVEGMPNANPRYATTWGLSPLEFRVDAGYVEETYEESLHRYDFNNVDNSLDLMYRVFADGAANFVYQQQFTIYYDLYYWEPAPDGASALPDF